MTERTFSFSSKCPTSFSIDTHICSWKLPNAASCLLYFWPAGHLLFVPRCKRKERTESVLHNILSLILQFLKSSEDATSTFLTPDTLVNNVWYWYDNMSSVENFAIFIVVAVSLLYLASCRGQCCKLRSRAALLFVCFLIIFKSITWRSLKENVLD